MSDDEEMWLPVPLGALRVGQPAPFDVYDPYGMRVLTKGEVLQDAKLARALVTVGQCTASDLAGAELSIEALPYHNPGVGLEEFRLNVNTLMSVSYHSEHAPLPCRLLGRIDGAYLQVTPVVEIDERMRLLLKEGGEVSVRIALGRDVLTFTSVISATQRTPLWHLYLVWPQRITVEQARQAPRVPAHQPVFIERQGDVRRTGVLLNLSEHGALIRYHSILGKVDDGMTLRFILPDRGRHPMLSTQAIIRNHYLAPGSDELILHGVAFDPDDDTRQLIRRHLQRLMLSASWQPPAEAGVPVSS
ncbi:PilZ domain-containing protein [Chitinibacteraceae bacterium HSL-7]